MIVADTGAIIALVDADDRHHETLRDLFNRDPDAWILPWAVLPEVDYLLATHVGAAAQEAFLTDLAAGAFSVEWGDVPDLIRARDLRVRYRDLGVGLVDAVVLATAERLRAQAIATLDLRHLGAVRLDPLPSLLPRDL